ncbi:hypothetical protein IKI14_05155 [bacterium]|nr:hypothetical protein [bacterium]
MSSKTGSYAQIHSINETQGSFTAFHHVALSGLYFSGKYTGIGTAPGMKVIPCSSAKYCMVFRIS